MLIRGLILSMIAAMPMAHAAIVPAGAAGVHCAATAEAAVSKMLSAQAAGREFEFNELLGANEASGSQGFRVVRVRFDAVAQRRWAMVASCSEPSRPLRSLALPKGASGVQTLVPAAITVHTGDAVTLIRETGDSRVELHGTAIESGSVGAPLRVRLASFADNNNEPAPVLRCTVLGPGLVEVLP